MMELPTALYDDGSSTESEYYFDITEKLEGEEAAHTLVQEYDVSSTQEPLNGEISLPQGSEWSHGVASIVSDNAVEQALAMAQDLRKTTERDESLMTDTTNRNASPIEKKKMKTVMLKKRKRGENKSEIGSLKKVKATSSPVLVTKPIVELLQKQSGHGETKSEMIGSSRRTERRYPAARQRKPQGRSPSNRRKNCSNSPTRCSVEQEGRTKRDSSPVIQTSRRSRSRSPPRRRVEDRRTKSRSRSTCGASTVSRSHRVGEKAPRRQHHLEKRPSHTYIRPQSPSLFPRSVQATQGERDKHHHHKSRYSHYDSHELKSTEQPSGEKSANRQSLSCRESARISRGDRETFQHRKRDYHRSKSVHNREKLITPRRDDNKSGNRMMTEAEIPNAELATRDFHKQKSIDQTKFRVLPAAPVSKRTKRSPHPRSRVNTSATSSDDGKKSKHVARHDAFERQVFKLKLREADIDEKITAGPCDEFNNGLCDNRKRAAAEERARLMAQDLKRFEKVYASLDVTPFQLKRYQTDRDFGWRVVQFKRKQASLEEQNDLLMSLERKADLRCWLDKEREKLIAENATLFHAVMMSQDRTYNQRERKDFGASANILQGSGQRALGADVHQRQPNLKHPTSVVSDSSHFTSAANISRVVVGAALQLKGDNVCRT